MYRQWASWTTRQAGTPGCRRSRSRSTRPSGWRTHSARRSRWRWPDVANLWTRPPDVREAARKKWPVLLAAFAAGQEWQPMDIPLRGPAPSEIGERLGDVQEWVAEWERADRGPLRVEYKRVGGRHFGINMIPARAWLDGYEQAWTLLGAGADVRKLTEMAERVKAECPRLVPWLVARPAKALRLAGEWRHLLATVR